MTSAQEHATAGGGWARTRRVSAALALLAALASFVAPRHAFADEPPPPASAELGEAPILSAGPLEYRPGRGLRLGSTGAGDRRLHQRQGRDHTEESGGEFALDRLNFFLIFDRFTRFRAVAELQLKDIFVADEEQAGTQDFAFDVRRLFGDFTVADALHAARRDLPHSGRLLEPHPGAAADLDHRSRR